MKKRKNYLYRLTKKDIREIGGLVAADEEFRKVKGESGIFISNYARIISKRRKNPRLLFPQFHKGYYKLTFPQYRRGKKIKTMHYVHVLVARAFLVPGAWIKKGDTLEVHLIEPKSANNRSMSLHYADNLMFVPHCIHRAIDSITEIAIRNGDEWKVVDFVTAAGTFNISPYELMDAIGYEKHNQPTRKDEVYQYYHKTVESAGIDKEIYCRIRRRKYHNSIHK